MVTNVEPVTFVMRESARSILPGRVVAQLRDFSSVAVIVNAPAKCRSSARPLHIKLD